MPRLLESMRHGMKDWHLPTTCDAKSWVELLDLVSKEDVEVLKADVLIEYKDKKRDPNDPPTAEKGFGACYGTKITVRTMSGKNISYSEKEHAFIPSIGAYREREQEAQRRCIATARTRLGLLKHRLGYDLSAILRDENGIAVTEDVLKNLDAENITPYPLQATRN